jgi:Zn-dependent protease with chaperone function
MCNRVLARQHSSPLPIPKVFAPAHTRTENVKRVLRSIGQTTILIYSSFATLFTLINTYMISVMYGLNINAWLFWIIGGLISLLFIIAAYFLSKRAGQKIIDILTYQEAEEEKYKEAVRREAEIIERLNQIGVSPSISLAQTPAALPSNVDLAPELSASTKNISAPISKTT